MNILLYIIIFVIGTLFGSFFTLAIYRIPKKEDITHKHSYCPNCNHKLGLMDLFPIFSYIFLKGRCRYCKQKIRPKYLIIEILTGLLFVLISYLIDINIYNLTLTKIIDSAFIALYLCFVIILAGIDKENRKIEKSISMYGIVISIMYMIYLCVVIEKVNVYRYIIYLIFYSIILILDTITLRRYAKSKYINGLLLTVITMCIFTGEYVTINTVAITAFAVAIYILLYKLKNLKNRNKKTDKQVWKTISIGYFLGIANVISLIFSTVCYKFFYY